MLSGGRNHSSAKCSFVNSSRFSVPVTLSAQGCSTVVSQPLVASSPLHQLLSSQLLPLSSSASSFHLLHGSLSRSLPSTARLQSVLLVTMVHSHRSRPADVCHHQSRWPVSQSIRFCCWPPLASTGCFWSLLLVSRTLQAWQHLVFITLFNIAQILRDLTELPSPYDTK